MAYILTVEDECDGCVGNKEKSKYRTVIKYSRYSVDPVKKILYCNGCINMSKYKEK